VSEAQGSRARHFNP